MARFAEKVVIVTGAASGIGEAVARRLAAEGARLVLGDRNADGLRRVADSIKDAKVETLAGSVSAIADCEALVKRAREKFGRIDVLVNNAGVDHLGRIDEGDLSAFTKVIETDLYGVVQMSRAAIAALRESRGCIVNVSSVSGLGGDWNHSFYCAAKGAVTNFTRALALDEARNGVRVNAVNPSLVYTPFTAGMKEQPDLVAAFEVRIPMGRGAEPGDIVGAVAFLASEDAHFITGVNLPVDGGTSASNGQPRSASVAKPRLPDSWVPEMAVFDDKANFVARVRAAGTGATTDPTLRELSGVPPESQRTTFRRRLTPSRADVMLIDVTRRANLRPACTDVTRALEARRSRKAA